MASFIADALPDSVQAGGRTWASATLVAPGRGGTVALGHGVASPGPEESGVQNLVPMVLVAAAVLFVLPLWPWSRGWGWVPAGVLGMGLATMLLFTWAVEPL
jgi:hypothetical protein